ncbi:hypothetical protein [Prochlorococcus sp. MIT 1011]|uniref:hypothetical protein n=1 Tax=Prochlorococcus sp. MIT 1011 TaxID=3082520 RepID=UPI0039B38C4A
MRINNNLIFSTGRDYREARIWSNTVLRKVGYLFKGNIVNISGWKDEDKQGGFYKNYFPNSKSYSITNYGEGVRGDLEDGQMQLDLESKLPKELIDYADVVFNHTTLEHVFDIFTAFRNLSLMTNDILILVVPAIQEEHYSDSLGDYWRFMSGSILKLLEKNKLTPLTFTSTPYRNCSIYHFIIASKKPERWKNKLSIIESSINEGSEIIRSSILERVINKVIRLTKK